MKFLRLNKAETEELRAKGRIEVERNGFTIIVEGELKHPSDYKIYVVNPYNRIYLY